MIQAHIRFARRCAALVLLLTAVAPQPTACLAGLMSGAVGGGQPHDNVQPSLALNYIVRMEGLFEELGEVKLFAGSFAPRGWALADGQLLDIASHTALFAQLGTTYGGDGRTNFALPDLRGRVAVHDGMGQGLSNRRLGERFGQEQTTLSLSQLPSHSHTAPSPYNATDLTGGGQPHSEMQPSLGLNYLIALQGAFPSRNVKDQKQPPDGLLSVTPYFGAVAMSAAHVAPSGWAFADGQLLMIDQNQALFSILGTTYGGDGRMTFGLPDLRGRTPLGPRTGPGLTTRELGQQYGAEQVTLNTNQIPSHTHTLPFTSDVTHEAGLGQAHSNLQPTLGLNYVIALNGLFPSRNLTADATGESAGVVSGEPFIGEVGLFAGNFAPRGWAMADGQILPISGNDLLFSLLGTTYGGDGRSTFGLPDLRGRVALHAGAGPGLTTRRLGWSGGVEQVALDVTQIPSHMHPLFVVVGDSNGDGAVDTDDLNNVRNNFGAMGPADGTLPGDTFPFDGKVNIDDLNAVRNNFGADWIATPEPSSLALAALLGLLMPSARPHRRQTR